MDRSTQSGNIPTISQNKQSNGAHRQKGKKGAQKHQEERHRNADETEGV